MNEQIIQFIVSYNKTKLQVPQFKLTDTISSLKLYLETVTQLSPSHQKLIFKGVLKDTDTLHDAGIHNNSKVILVGSTLQQIQEVQDSVPIALPPPKKKQKVKPRPTTGGGIHSISAYGFDRFEVLPLPNSQQAHSILTRLANDQGIVTVMNKNKWKVGLLKELSPAIVDKLGFNLNKGQEIALRLRFEDGFRTYTSIRDVLCHELAHMEWSEHDANFHALNRTIVKEVKANGLGEGNRVGGKEIYIPEEDYDYVSEDKLEGGTFRLGGEKKEGLSLRELVGEAAVLRLSKFEQEMVEKCGGWEQEQEQEKEKEKEKKATVDLVNATQLQQQQDKMDIDATEGTAGTKKEEKKVENKGEEQTMQTVGGVVEKEQENKKNSISTNKSGIWKCAMCGYSNVTGASKCKVCGKGKSVAVGQQNNSSSTETTVQICPRCTFVNDNTNSSSTTTPKVCTMCGYSLKGTSAATTDNKQQQQQQQQVAASWSCAICTFVNQHHGRTCGMCNSPRGNV